MFDAYPAVIHAVSFVELIFHGEHDIWGKIVGADPTIDPAGMREWVRKGMDKYLSVGRIAVARAELDHPQFLKYLAGKLGYV